MAGDEQNWFAVDVKRGEVLWIEVFGDRIDSPIDPAVSVFDDVSERRHAERARRMAASSELEAQVDAWIASVGE